MQPIRAQVFESRQSQWSSSCERTGSEFVRLERPVCLPAAVGRIEIVGRDEHLVSARLRGFEDPLHVLDCLVLGDARSDGPPIGSLLAQHVVLGVDKDYCRVDPSDFHGLLSMLAAQRSLPASGDAKWDPSPVVFNGGLALTRGKMRSERSRAMFERLKDCAD